MRLPEKLTLVQERDTLAIQDAQECEHVVFKACMGDPTEWSANIVLMTCVAVGVTECYTLDDDDAADLTVEGLISRWHTHLGADDGFIPGDGDEGDYNNEIGWKRGPGDPR